jgi:hypothetical protein
MSLIANKFYPLSDLFFQESKKLDLTPGQGTIAANDSYISGLHIFKWGPNSSIVIETSGGQTITFPPTSLVEGAVYYINIKRVIRVLPNSDETIIMGISTTNK